MSAKPDRINHYFAHYQTLICHRKPDPLCASSAKGASGFCQTMPPSDRQLMGIGASEHRTLVRAKARFAGQKAQEHSFVRRNAVTPDILPGIVAGIFANLGYAIMACISRCGRRTQSTGINMGCRSRPTQLECGQRRLPSAESDGKCRACLAFPEVPASDLPVLIHSRWNASCQPLCGTRLRQV